MFQKAIKYLNQPTPSSFRRENSTPNDIIPTFTPKMEPLWKSVLLDYRDLPRAAISESIDWFQFSVKQLTDKIMSPNFTK